MTYLFFSFLFCRIQLFSFLRPKNSNRGNISRQVGVFEVPYHFWHKACLIMWSKIGKKGITWFSKPPYTSDSPLDILHTPRRHGHTIRVGGMNRCLRRLLIGSSRSVFRILKPTDYNNTSVCSNNYYNVNINTTLSPTNAFATASCSFLSFSQGLPNFIM